MSGALQLCCKCADAVDRGCCRFPCRVLVVCVKRRGCTMCMFTYVCLCVCVHCVLFCALVLKTSCVLPGVVCAACCTTAHVGTHCSTQQHTPTASLHPHSCPVSPQPVLDCCCKLWRHCRLNRDNVPLHQPATCSGASEGVEVELALQWVSDAFTDTLVGFANSIKTIDGGSHMDGLRAALTRLVNAAARKAKVCCLQHGGGWWCDTDTLFPCFRGSALSCHDTAAGLPA